MKPAKVISLILIAIGIAISIYLLFRHFAITNPSTQRGIDFCTAMFGKGCDDALRSPWAVLFGVPLAGWGLVFYIALVSLLLLGWTIGETFYTEAMTGALVLALGATLASMVLLLVMITDLSPFCPLCATVHTINFLLLFPLKQMTKCSTGQLMRTVRGTIRYLMGGKVSDPAATRWQVVGFLVPGLVAVVVYQWVYLEYTLHHHSAEAPFNPQQTLASFKANPLHDILLNDTDPQLGSTNAPVHMVVFNDFQCPGCKQFAQNVHNLSQQYGDSLHIVFKHFPLDSTCNSLIKHELHPRACTVALAAEAAHQQDKFWAFHKVLFSPDTSQKRTLKSIVDDLNLNHEQFTTYFKNKAALAKVQADISLGIHLGVVGTPSVFINGRMVSDIRPQTLEFLINHEINNPAPPHDERVTHLIIPHD